MKHPRLAILISQFNHHITQSLLRCCVDELGAHGIKRSQIKIIWVPGAYELPFFSQKLARSNKFNAIICLGCIIKGKTAHDVYIAHWTSIGIGLSSLNTGVPVVFGVLTTKNDRQAKIRARKGPLNRGKEAAHTALELIRLNHTL